MRLFIKFLLLLLFLIFNWKVPAQVSFTYHSPFSYLKGKDASAISPVWMNPGYNYSSWASGNAPFRYGDGTSGIELTDMQNNYSVIYLRSVFECSNAQLIKNLLLSVDYDDGFVIWINGVLALSKNAPVNLTYNAFAPLNHESGTGEDYPVDATLLNLKEGPNIIAVQCFNVSLASTDFYFDLAFLGELSIPEITDTTGVDFSIQSGFMTNPFNVVLTSPDPASQIIYTLDGSNPQDSKKSFIHNSPVTVKIDPVSATGRPLTPAVIIRASLSKAGYKPSVPCSRTYIFIDKVKTQSWPGGEWPNMSINGQLIDLDVDSRVVNSTAYSGLINNSLLDIPTLSVITDPKNLFDPASGIYVNATGHGLNWEKECSFELINPDGTKGFSINAGLRIRGGWSRNDDFPKHSFRLFFREIYGSDKLHYPLFGKEGVDQFDKIDLRTEQNYSWSRGLTFNSFVREVFSRDTQRDMGQPYTRSRYYHLYLNGMYWGLYQTQERSEARFASSYLGGNDEDYDVVKVNTVKGYVIEATDGNLNSWQKLWDMCTTGFTSNESYYALEGKDAEGKPKKGGEVFVDIDNLIDYMLVIFYTGNFDAPCSSFSNNKKTNNFYAIDDRLDKSKGFTFYAHDSEHSLFDEAHSPGVGITENRVNLGSINGITKMEISTFSFFHPQWLHYKLTANSEYRSRFADRAYKSFQTGGVFSAESALIRLNIRVKEVGNAIIAESARWGDANRGTSAPYTKNDQWIPEIEKIRTRFIPNRPSVVISQLKAEGLYPMIKSPQIICSDGEVFSTEMQLSTPLPVKIVNPNSYGTIYYTFDGQDPNIMTSGIHPEARMSLNNIELTINESTVLKVRVLNNGLWSALTEVNFIKMQDDFSKLKVTELNYHPSDFISGYDTTSGQDLEFIEFKNTGISSINLSGLKLDSAVTYSFPDNFLLPPKQFFVVSSKPSQFFEYYGMRPSGNFQGNFSNSGEEVLLKDSIGNMIIDFVYSDASPWPNSADGEGFSLSSLERNPNGNPQNVSYWVSSLMPDGNPFADNYTDPYIPELLQDGSVVAYPNPTSGLFTVQFINKVNILSLDIAVFNLTGKQVFIANIGNPGLIDLSDLGLPNGIYYVRVSAKRFIKRLRIILVK